MGGRDPSWWAQSSAPKLYPARVESGSAAPGGGPAAVRAGPAAEAPRWGRTEGHHRGQRKHFSGRNLPNASVDGAPGQPSHVRIFPLPHPLRSHHTPHLRAPPRLRLGPHKTARPASLSKKIETIDKRKNCVWT